MESASDQQHQLSTEATEAEKQKHVFKDNLEGEEEEFEIEVVKNLSGEQESNLLAFLQKV